MRRRTVLPALLALSVTACASANHRYGSAMELRSAAVNSGLHCTGYDPAPPPAGAATAGTCVGGGTHASFVVYDKDDAAKKGIAEAKKRLSKGSAILSGPNWYLTASTSEVKSLQDAVGGDLTAA